MRTFPRAALPGAAVRSVAAEQPSAAVDRGADDGRAMLLKGIPEKVWRAQVLAWAKRGGWRAYWTWSSLHSPAGFPDICLVRGGRLVFAELKRDTGKLTQAQRDWLADLLLVPCVEVHVWRPTDERAVRAVLLDEAA